MLRNIYEINPLIITTTTPIFVKPSTVFPVDEIQPEVSLGVENERGQGNVHFPCSADHEQDWQPYPVDPYSAESQVLDIHALTIYYCHIYFSLFPWRFYFFRVFTYHFPFFCTCVGGE